MRIYLILIFTILVQQPAWSGGRHSKIAAWPDVFDDEEIFLDDVELISGELDIAEIGKSRPIAIEIIILDFTQFEAMLDSLHSRRDLQELTIKFAWIPLSVDNFLRLVKVLRGMTKLTKLDLHLKFAKSFEAEALRILTETLLELPKLRNWSLLERWFVESNLNPRR